MSDLAGLSAVEQRERLLKGEIKAVEIAKSHLEVIKTKEGSLKSFISVAADVVDQAKSVDNKFSEKRPMGRLAGVCVAVKDNICTSGLKTTAGSKFLSEFIPTYDATVVRKLKSEDAVIIGKTNLDEFAMGSSTEYSAFGPTRNPYAHDKTPGGSSGGSACSVASCESAVSLGSDTGGSIRQPAFMCGVYGFKPTYGAVSRYGLIAFGSSLDQIGPMARTIKDLRIVFDVISGHDSLDSTSVPKDLGLTKKERFKIGIPTDIDFSSVDGVIGRKFDELRSRLAGKKVEFVDVCLPHSKYAIETYYIVACAEASSNLSRYDGVHFTKRSAVDNIEDVFYKSRSEFFGPEVKRRIMIGTFVLAKGYYDAYYQRALKVRRLIRGDFD
ncbi:MAG: Asp-tRNA(Asn)/Glu-tRNA(Gln) amidotransferase subunit GatA, partial [Planctomycetes bacterium]|nr:Asp-tRNA(Asn)/Glu-tRNA(Gln) amidotransferase subunit GatA [Planctomycetota bacterium]